MEITLTPELFTNNKYALSYGSREALFTIIDEEFKGDNRLGRINRITILVREFSGEGKETGASFCTTVIGLGDGVVGITSNNAELRGKLLNKDNMGECTVILYEDE